MDARHQSGAAVSASALLDVVAAGNHELWWLGVRRDVLPGRDVVLEHASAAALKGVRCDHGGQRDAECGARRDPCCLCRRRVGLIRDRAGRRDRPRCGGRDRRQASLPSPASRKKNWHAGQSRPDGRYLRTGSSSHANSHSPQTVSTLTRECPNQKPLPRGVSEASKTVIVGSSVGLHACRSALISESRRQGWCPSTHCPSRRCRCRLGADDHDAGHRGRSSQEFVDSGTRRCVVACVGDASRCRSAATATVHCAASRATGRTCGSRSKASRAGCAHLTTRRRADRSNSGVSDQNPGAWPMGHLGAESG